MRKKWNNCFLRHIVESELRDLKHKENEQKKELDLSKPVRLPKLCEPCACIANDHEREAHREDQHGDRKPKHSCFHQATRF